MKSLIIAILALLAVYWLLAHAPESDYQKDIRWCIENGGHWINAYYNEHCSFPPTKNTPHL